MSNPYDRGFALIFRFANTRGAQESAEILAEALEDYGLMVNFDDDELWDLGKKTQTKKALSRVTDWAEEQESEEGKKLMLFCYVGHGTVDQEKGHNILEALET